jgi:uncharacterized membrane protein YphA (DoxX/SURF4 family)
MTNLPIPIQVLYAGLAGTVLALIVASIMNRWSIRVFFLLALRLAIGWHFLFEGLYKINSHLIGTSETNRPFSSEPYFRNAPGPIGAFMRKQYGDPAEAIADRVRIASPLPDFKSRPVDEQAAACPASVARQLDDMQDRAQEAVKAEAAKELARADADEAKALKDAKTDTEKSKAKDAAENSRADARRKSESAAAIAKERITAAKAAYARWVQGAEGRSSTIKRITGEIPLTAPQRLEHLDSLRREVKSAEERAAADLGNGAGIEQKRSAELRADLIAAESDLAKDADAFVADLKKELNGDQAVTEDARQTRGQLVDRVTMWFLVVVGACLMAGLLTRLACVLGAGFLVVTYLAYPPFPWYPLPPNTEGNPVFVNKNVIEFLALLVLATFPTGRWMGLDALIARLMGRRYADAT